MSVEILANSYEVLIKCMYLWDEMLKFLGYIWKGFVTNYACVCLFTIQQEKEKKEKKENVYLAIHATPMKA